MASKKRWCDDDLCVIGVGISCVRIVNSDQRHVSVVLIFLHKTEGQLVVLSTFLSNLGSYFYCNCGHNFQRKGDLTKIKAFVRLPTNM